MIKPKFEDFDYGEGRKDLSWLQYAKALEEYVTFLEAQDPELRQTMKNSKGQTLEQPYLALARIRRAQKPYDDALLGFSWEPTPEGYEWWERVYHNDFLPAIPKASLAELEAWRKATISKTETVELDYKAMYDELSQKITELQEEYDENGFNCTPDIKLQRIKACFDDTVKTLLNKTPYRNWVAECAMRHYVMGSGDISYSWDKAQQWAEEGKKRGHI